VSSSFDVKYFHHLFSFSNQAMDGAAWEGGSGTFSRSPEANTFLESNSYTNVLKYGCISLICILFQ